MFKPCPPPALPALSPATIFRDNEQRRQHGAATKALRAALGIVQQRRAMPDPPDHTTAMHMEELPRHATEQRRPAPPPRTEGEARRNRREHHSGEYYSNVYEDDDAATMTSRPRRYSSAQHGGGAGHGSGGAATAAAAAAVDNNFPPASAPANADALLPPFDDPGARTTSTMRGPTRVKPSPGEGRGRGGGYEANAGDNRTDAAATGRIRSNRVEPSGPAQADRTSGGDAWSSSTRPRAGTGRDERGGRGGRLRVTGGGGGDDGDGGSLRYSVNKGVRVGNLGGAKVGWRGAGRGRSDSGGSGTWGLGPRAVTEEDLARLDDEIAHLSSTVEQVNQMLFLLSWCTRYECVDNIR